jgi:hypothetical protein
MMKLKYPIVPIHSRQIAECNWGHGYDDAMMKI